MVWSEEIDFQAAYDASASTRAGHQPRWGEDVSLRMVMVHVLLEYGRHNGHADFLREGVDGTVGA